MSVSQTILLTTYPYGATPFSSIALHDPDTDAVIDPDEGTYVGTQTGASTGVYAIVRTNADDILMPAGLYRLRCMVDGSPLNRYVDLTGVDGEIAYARIERAAALDSAALALINKIEASTAGTVSGAGTDTEIFVGSNVTLTITVDEDGNRSAVVVS